MSVFAIIKVLGPTGHRPDNSLPGEQPGIDNSLPGLPSYPDNTLPGLPSYPDNSLPPFPAQPLPPWLPKPPGKPVHLPVFPYDPARPDNSLPDPGDEPHPEHPIVIGSHFVLRWSPFYGFILVPVDDATEPEPK